MERGETVRRIPLVQETERRPDASNSPWNPSAHDSVAMILWSLRAPVVAAGQQQNHGYRIMFRPALGHYGLSSTSRGFTRSETQIFHAAETAMPLRFLTSSTRLPWQNAVAAQQGRSEASRR